MGQTGESEPDESQRIRELLTGNGYIFHGTRVTGLTWAYRLSGGNLRAVQLLLGHTKIESTVRYLGIEVDDALSIAEQVDL